MTKFRFTRPTSIVTVAVLAGLFFAPGASAHGAGKGAGHRGKQGAGFFEKADANGDGKIQKAEADKLAEARFAKGDTNKDGVITKQEAQKASETARAERSKHMQARLDKMFERADKNKNGKVEKSESRLPAERFDKIDANKDGSLTKAEMKAAFSRFAKAGGQKMFERLDTNSDGKITRAEAQAKAAERFAKMDLNKDGAVTKEEARSAMTQLHKGKRGPHRGGKHGQAGQRPGKQGFHKRDRKAGEAHNRTANG
jgi:Ca2+-binding EF-hand superfamily protein